MGTKGIQVDVKRLLCFVAQQRDATDLVLGRVEQTGGAAPKLIGVGRNRRIVGLVAGFNWADGNQNTSYTLFVYEQRQCSAYLTAIDEIVANLADGLCLSKRLIGVHLGIVRIAHRRQCSATDGRVEQSTNAAVTQSPDESSAGAQRDGAGPRQSVVRLVEVVDGHYSDRNIQLINLW